MDETYVPPLILLVLSIVNAVMMVMMFGYMVSPLRPAASKEMPYKSGTIPLATPAPSS